MSLLCHNCRQAIPAGAAFCPDCGAPQLRVQGSEAQPEQDAPAPLRHTGEIVWPAAVASAAIYAVPAGLLFVLTPLPLINIAWVAAGSFLTLRRYRRRAPRAPALTLQLGGRIGLVLGLFVAVISTAAQALSFLVSRFGLHQGALVDAQLQSSVRAYMDHIPSSDPDAVAQIRGMLHFLLTPEGQGASLLLSAGFAAVTILFFAWLGGRYSVRFGTRPRRG